jgi:hypothetical protein
MSLVFLYEVDIDVEDFQPQGVAVIAVKPAGLFFFGQGLLSVHR